MKLEYEVIIDAKPQEVWSALLEPEYTKEVYMGCYIQSTFQPGAAIQYVGPGVDGEETIHVFGKILTFEPYQTWSFTHHVGKSYQPETDKYESRITYQLESVDKGTRLTLIHDQWEADDPSYQGSKESWPTLLEKTKSLVEKKAKP